MRSNKDISDNDLRRFEYPHVPGGGRASSDLALAYDDLSARDAVHAAQMKRLKIEMIFSFDTGFDILPGLKRIPA